MAKLRQSACGQHGNKARAARGPAFIGYIVNSYNVYGKQPIADHRAWMEKIPEKVQTYLSEKHCRNGLVRESWKKSIKHYSRLRQNSGQVPRARSCDF